MLRPRYAGGPRDGTSRSGRTGDVPSRRPGPLWAWVQTIAVSLGAQTTSTMACASWAGSMTTASWSSRTIHTLLSKSQVPLSRANCPDVRSRSMRAAVRAPPSSAVRHLTVGSMRRPLGRLGMTSEVALRGSNRLVTSGTVEKVCPKAVAVRSRAFIWRA